MRSESTAGKGRGPAIALVISLVFIVVGAIAYGAQEALGPGIVGMNNAFSWGLYIALFETFMGIAAGCLLVASIASLFRVRALRAFAPYAAVGAFAFLAAGGLMIMQDLGAIRNMLYMVTDTNFSSPLAGDMIIMSFFAIVSLVLAYVLMVPIWKERGFFLAWWAKGRDDASLRAGLDRVARLFGLFGLVVGIATPIITSLIFEEMTGRIWWNTPVTSVDFVALAVASGFALALLLGAVKFGGDGLGARQKGADLLAKTTAIALAVHLVLFFGQLAALGASGSLQGGRALETIADCWPAVALEVVLPLVAIVGFLVKRGRESRGFLVAGSLLAIVGSFVPRMLMMYAGFNVAPMSLNVMGTGVYWAPPIATGVGNAASVFQSATAYLPTLPELGVALLPVGVALFIVAICVNHAALPES